MHIILCTYKHMCPALSSNIFIFKSEFTALQQCMFLKNENLLSSPKTEFSFFKNRSKIHFNCHPWPI